MQKLYTIEELAESLGVKKATIYHWVYRKRIKPVKVGRLLRFTIESIEAFLRFNSRNAKIPALEQDYKKPDKPNKSDVLEIPDMPASKWEEI